MDNSTDDSELLRTYLSQGSHDAFRVLVDRYLGLVFATARRRGCDFHAAQDVAQAVFITLAQKAGTIRRGSPLSLWLHNTTRYITANAMRMDRSRQRHEQRAAAMIPKSISQDIPVEVSENQEAISALLEHALDSLRETDRAAILLRFYQGRNYVELGAALGASAHAAEVRVSRALEKLRRYLSAKGTVVQSAGIVTALTARTADAAPAGLNAMVCTAALGSGTPAAAAALAPSSAGARRPIAGWIAACAALLILLVGFFLMPARHQRRSTSLLPVAANNPAPLAVADAPPQPPPSTQPIRLTSGFENSPPLAVTQISPAHVAVSLINEPGLMDHQFFLFRLDNVRGRTIQVDFHAVLVKKWATLNPVFSYDLDVDDPYLYASRSIQEPNAFNSGVRDSRGQPLPDTGTQDWHYITRTWTSGTDAFCFSLECTADSVLIAMRPPYRAGYNEKFFEKLRANPAAKVIEIGRTPLGRPLLMAEIGNPANETRKPCVLVYAGEHADDEDSMWVANGLIEHLLEDNDGAKQLRDNFTFLIIPMLDPDASAASIHSGIIVGFLTSSMRPANIAFANWFAGWVNAGKRLDLAISLGNVQSSEASNFHCATMEGLGERGRAAHTLNGFFFSDLALADFSISPQPELYGWCPNRLGGWLARRYGPLTLAYMVNTQAAKHHLTVQQTRDLGGGMVDAIPEFFASPDGPILLANVDARRKERLDRWAPMPSAPKPSSPTALAGRTAAMMIRSSTGSPGRQNRPRNTPMRWQRICTFR